MNDGDKTISIFQEWVPGSVTTLLVNFGPFSDRRVASYTKQILHGLLYLHSERVIHRDIKGSNILIDDRGVVKLCDFGASKVGSAPNKHAIYYGGNSELRAPHDQKPKQVKLLLSAVSNIPGTAFYLVQVEHADLTTLV